MKEAARRGRRRHPAAAIRYDGDIMATTSSDSAAASAAGIGYRLTSGAFCGFAIGSVLALADPLIVVAARGQAAAPDGLAMTMAESVALVVPVLTAVGLLAGAGLFLLGRIWRAAAAFIIRLLPVVWVVLLTVYVGAAYYGGEVGYVAGAKAAVVAIIVGVPSYLALKALCLRLRRGRARGAIIVSAVLAAALFVPLAAWLAAE
jgi:hypothetical protein